MATVRTTFHIYEIDVYPIDALPGSGETWAAMVRRATKVIDGNADLRIAQAGEHHGVTAGAALDAALDDAMNVLMDDNPA